jgi:PPOX class probable F420-dependent enzyme
MSALGPAVAAFLDAHITGVLATVSAQGHPRQSTVYFARDGDRLLVTTEAGRGKARDVERTGWASLCVTGHGSPFPSATVAGPAAILTDGIGPPTAAVMQRIMGTEDPPEPQTDEALAAVGRVILEITIERVGPTTYLDD